MVRRRIMVSWLSGFQKTTGCNPSNNCVLINHCVGSRDADTMIWRQTTSASLLESSNYSSLIRVIMGYPVPSGGSSRTSCRNSPSNGSSNSNSPFSSQQNLHHVSYGSHRVSYSFSKSFILTLAVGITFGFSFAYLLLSVISWEWV